jgi:hypothetical protein
MSRTYLPRAQWNVVYPFQKSYQLVWGGSGPKLDEPGTVALGLWLEE